MNKTESHFAHTSLGADGNKEFEGCTFVDAHAHLSFPDYNPDRESIIQRLRENRVGLIINPGTNVETSRDAIACAESLDFVYANVGLHPCDVNEFDEDSFSELETLAKHPKVVAIGEIGLDYHYPETNKQKEEHCFRTMLRIAKKLDLPVIIHTRDAWSDTFRILEEEKSSNLRGMMHCFSGTIEEAARSIELGFKISIPGIITFKKSNLPEVVKALPLSEILTETDCPFLAPVPHRGKRNEPAFVIEVAKKIAEVKSLPIQSVAKAVLGNTVSLFNIKVEL
ncbi:MAG: TatD family hydrolase [Chloroherpetonaceae bacterium]|nr:TatD family hydrolase [Chloroherpetonaceae bacterium]